MLENIGLCLSDDLHELGEEPLAGYPLPVDEVDFLVQANSPIKTAADLKGKNIAHQNGTTGTYSLIKYLETAGLRLSDVQAVSLSGADAFTAFAQGSIDGWIHWQPATALALTKLGQVPPAARREDLRLRLLRRAQ
ncbi:ABC transporter substrate-binding protein [Bradyrhizobium sp. i1.15.2]|uniref:ABC transporter substrate-binding protein n=1 Tax=Bradyrhizobium sp. i1.15.2 TaxID=3156362 RepID=UPI00339438F3